MLPSTRGVLSVPAVEVQRVTSLHVLFSPSTLSPRKVKVENESV